MLEGTFTPSQIIAGNDPITMNNFTLKSGVVVAAFSALMLEVATGKLIAFDKATLGTNITVGIAPEALDATSGDKEVTVYTGGKFNKDLVVFATTPTDAQKATAFAGTPINLAALI